MLPKPLYDEERAACSKLRGGGFFHGCLSRLTPELWGGVTSSHLSSWRTLKKALLFAWRTEPRDETVKRYDEAVKSLRQPLETDPGRWVAAGSAHPEAIIEPHCKASPFIALYLERIVNLTRNGHRLQSDCAAAIGVIAILRYRADRGVLPEGWEDVVEAGYLKEVPRDRFRPRHAPTDEVSFAYTKTPSGFTVTGTPNYTKPDTKPIVFWPTDSDPNK